MLTVVAGNRYEVVFILPALGHTELVVPFATQSWTELVVPSKKCRLSSMVPDHSFAFQAADNVQWNVNCA